MKRLVLMVLTSVLAGALGAAFITGLVWTLVPIGGSTLPHVVEGLTGVAFGWAALLISSLLAIAAVGCIAVSALLQVIAADRPQDT